MSIGRIKSPQVMHPLAETDLISVDMEWDETTRCWTTFVPELDGISTFGKSYEEALDHTADLIVGWLQTTIDYGQELPISRKRANEILRLLGH